MDVSDTSQTVTAGQLRSIIERAERLNEEKKTLNDDLKDLFAEAKGNGFHVPAIKFLIKRRQQDQAAREEFDTIVDLYMAALGMT